MTADRKAVDVILAALGLEQRQLAETMGYRPGYVANVLWSASVGPRSSAATSAELDQRQDR
ncbi:MAG: hypothetical protein ACRDLB_11940 [Actinomycetota bacterium]